MGLQLLPVTGSKVELSIRRPVERDGILTGMVAGGKCRGPEREESAVGVGTVLAGVGPATGSLSVTGVQLRAMQRLSGGFVDGGVGNEGHADCQ